jgi:hypothetical protein
MTDEIEQIFKAYLKRKIAKQKFNKDNKPFTKREMCLIRVSFMSGWNWQTYLKKKVVRK